MVSGVVSMVELTKEKQKELEFIKQEMDEDIKFNKFYQKKVIDYKYDNIIGLLEYNNIPITKITLYLSRLHSTSKFSFKLLSAMYNLDPKIIKFLIKEGDRNILLIKKADLFKKNNNLDIKYDIKFNKKIFKDKVLIKLKDKNCRYLATALYVATYKQYSKQILKTFNITLEEFKGFLLLYAYRVYKKLYYYEIADIFDVAASTIYTYFKIFNNIHSYYKDISKQ